MGTSYSLPRTPDDILSNVDEMENQDTRKYMCIRNLSNPIVQCSNLNMRILATLDFFPSYGSFNIFIFPSNDEKIQCQLHVLKM